MVESAMAVVPADRLVGVLLTGMGDDGARALADLHRAGGSTIAESEASATIYGMPRELVALGGAGRVLDADRIAGALRQIVR
jgi:two-component system chemotaxis response regulator CheB